LGVADPRFRASLARRAARGGLTVRQIERLAARRSQAPTAIAKPTLDANTREALEELQRHLGTRVHLRPRTKTQPGQIQIEFYDDAHLTRLYEQLMR
jgi:hypothetical protein